MPADAQQQAEAGSGALSLGTLYERGGNSLNFLRLVFALAVIASHATGLGGLGSGIIGGKTTVGTLAVYGFFGISGYLIAASATRNSLGRYLWLRFLRIFPGFWVCLVVTVALFGGIGFANAAHPATCHAGCYVTQTAVPWLGHHWFFRSVNWQTLRLSDPVYSWSIHGTVTAFGSPVDNGSLWSLFYEFLCYLLLGLLARTRVLQRRRVVLGLALVLWAWELTTVVHPQHLGQDPLLVMQLFPVFLTGTVIYLYRDVLRDSAPAAAVLAGLVIASVWLPIGGDRNPTSVDLFAPAMVYVVLWLGAHLPFRRVGVRNDYSYGFYIYALPIQQLLSFWGVQRAGYIVYLLACVAATAPFAVGSWWLVEKNCLRLKKVDVRRLTRGVGLDALFVEPSPGAAVEIAPASTSAPASGGVGPF